MTDDSDQLNQPRTIAASILLAIAGWAVFMGMPILVGSLSDTRGYSVEQVGYLASIELGGMLLASIFVSLSVRKLNRRNGAAAGLLLSLLINVISTQIDNYSVFLLARIFAGFGSGLCYSITIANLAATEQRARNFSYLIFVLVTVNAIELYTFPQIAGLWGVNGIFIAFAVLNALSLAIIKFIPTHIKTIKLRDEKDKAEADPQHYPAFLPWLCLFAIAAFYVCIGGFWAFIERLGVARGLSNDFIAISLSLTTLFSLVGCYFAYWLSKRAGQSLPLVISFGTIGCAVLFMGFYTSPLIYFAGLVVFQLLWNAADIYQLGTLSNIDRIGRFGALVPGAQGLGQTIGPAGTGFLLGQGVGFEGAMSFVAAMAFCAMAIYSVVHVWLSRYAPDGGVTSDK